jgi:hypothetical protein
VTMRVQHLHRESLAGVQMLDLVTAPIPPCPISRKGR